MTASEILAIVLSVGVGLILLWLFIAALRNPVLIKLGLEACFTDRYDVFVAGDLFWYPVEGRPDIRLAPDILAVIGRHKGHRGSYMQWVEDHIPPQVVFEILSPGNRSGEMAKKFEFYRRYGVEE